MTRNKRLSTPSFRVGRVRAFRRGRIWYLSYFEDRLRRQPRVGPDKDIARQLAAQTNAQLEVQAPSTLGFEPISVPDLRDRWLAHHEHVRRSSLQTIRRYRSATQHLLNFIDRVRPLRRASDLRPIHAEEFVRYLRSLHVAPNGHVKARKRRLTDCGIKFILETCSTLFGHAQQRRHLSAYADNPFRLLEVGRMPVENARPITVFDEEQEGSFLAACDDWQFPVFLTLVLTGLRPGELTHLLLPHDLELETGWLFVRNKPALGWKVKTRNERAVPLMPELVEVLRYSIGDRSTGAVFRQRRCAQNHVPPLSDLSQPQLERELVARTHRMPPLADDESEREGVAMAAKTVWRDLGALREDRVRLEFMRIMAGLGRPDVTAPKTLRHSFATLLQDANVDPLVRNELMGHAPAAAVQGQRGLGMTATYTHTRPETKRRQLEQALTSRPALEIARSWIAAVRSSCPTIDSNSSD